LTAVLQSLGSISRDAGLRLAGGLGEVVDAAGREKLSRNFAVVHAMLSKLDKAMRNRQLEPAALLQLLKQNRGQLERLWGEGALRQFFAVHGAPVDVEPRIGGPHVEELDAGEGLEACIEWAAEGLLPPAPDHGSARRRHLVQRALDILAEQYTKEIGLAQVADMLGITPNYLSTEFNRVVGESFSQYVTRLRMKEADALIRSGGLTVKEVASRVGYVSSRHFAALFKKNFGHVPSEHLG
jgi:AraC-like DNA-binding protein